MIIKSVTKLVLTSTAQVVVLQSFWNMSCLFPVNLVPICKQCFYSLHYGSLLLRGTCISQYHPYFHHLFFCFNYSLNILFILAWILCTYISTILRGFHIFVALLFSLVVGEDVHLKEVFNKLHLVTQSKYKMRIYKEQLRNLQR